MRVRFVFNGIASTADVWPTNDEGSLWEAQAIASLAVDLGCNWLLAQSTNEDPEIASALATMAARRAIRDRLTKETKP